MAIRTVFSVEFTKRMTLSNVAAALLLTPLLRWLVAWYTAPATRRGPSCRECDTELWPRSCGPTGRCFTCRSPVGAPPYLIEALTILAAALLVLSGLPGWERAAAGWWLASAIVLGCIDGMVHRLPLPYVSAMSAGTATLLAVAAASQGQWPSLQRAALAGLLLALVVFVLCLPRNGLGLGDATLAFPVGFTLGWFGWSALAGWVILGSILTGLTALALLLLRRVNWSSSLPLGPFMLLAVVAEVALR